MKIVVSGTSGLIGSHLVPALEAGGYEVFRLVLRPTGGEREIPWASEIQPQQVSGFDAVMQPLRFVKSFQSPSLFQE